MSKSGRASLWLAGSIILAACATDVAAQPDFIRSQSIAWQEGAEINLLVEQLEVWLDQESPYPRRSSAASIRVIDAAQAMRMNGQASLMGMVPRGFYDSESSTIYLVSPWSPHRAADASVLLHELAHHRQHTARHWYCPAAQELPAYRLQKRWLSERGLTAQINWVAVVLESGCTARDIHPD